MVNRKQIIKSACVLGLFTAVGVGLLYFLDQSTRSRIQHNEKNAWLESLQAIIPATEYDNDLLQDRIKVYSLPDLGTSAAVTVYRARRAGKPVALIFSPVAPKGYSGNIRLLVGIYYDGNIAGVRVLSHRETPGLGDGIELRKSDWILGFNGKSLENPGMDGWAIRPDGGRFDAFTGATITPRAVVKAIYNALAFFKQNRDMLFNKPSEEGDF